MNWHIARFSELRPPNVKDSALEIDILSAQTQGFAHPHSCCHQQAKKCRIGVGAESLGRGELLCSAKELFNLFVAVDVRGFALVTMREETCGRNLRVRFGGTEPNGEAANRT